MLTPTEFVTYSDDFDTQTGTADDTRALITDTLRPDATSDPFRTQTVRVRLDHRR